MLQFYKPNPSSKGSACSFWVDAKGSIMSSQIKQHSWDDKAKKGSFSQNKDNPNGKVMVKFSANEAAGIINAIQRNSSFSAYHQSSKQVVQISFEGYWKKRKEGNEWVKVGDQLGFSYRCTWQPKDDSTNKNTVVIGLDWSESKLLELYLQESLRKTFDFKEMDYKPQNKQFEKQANNEPQKATVPSDDQDLEW